MNENLMMQEAMLYDLIPRADDIKSGKENFQSIRERVKEI